MIVQVIKSARVDEWIVLISTTDNQTHLSG